MASNTTTSAEMPISEMSSTVNNPKENASDLGKEQDVVDENIEAMREAKKRMGLPSSGMEEGFYRFMHPMLAKMEESIKKNNEMLDEMQRKFDEEKEGRRVAELSKHIPGPLKGDGQGLEDIMRHIQNLIMYENFNNEETDIAKFIPVSLKQLDDHAQVAILGHNIAAYVSTLDAAHLRQFSTRIISDTTLWLSRMFRFNDSSAFFHEEERSGLVQVARLALHRRYPKYQSEGFSAFYPRPPVIYISAAAKPGLGQFICSELGFPKSCLTAVPCQTIDGHQQRMDIKVLEKLIQDDLVAAKVPLLLVANAGTPVLGHVDQISKLQDICKKNEIWLHIDGPNLATLAMYSVPTSVGPAKSGDSMTLNISGWFGLPAIPYVTLYKTADPTMAQLAGLVTMNLRAKLHCLPLWLSLQSLGHGGVVERIKQSINLSKTMVSGIEGTSSLKLVGRAKVLDEEEAEKRAKLSVIGELIHKAINALVIFEIENPTVVFRYQGNLNVETESSSLEENPKDINSQSEDVDYSEIHHYYDALNLWLCETLKREIPRLHITTVSIDGEGVCIRFCPIESAQVCDTTSSDVEQFLESIARQLAILDATVAQRDEFQDVVEAQDNLRLVYLPNWAGLGAIQYIPTHILPNVNALTDDMRKEVNTLNTNLVQQLKSADTAFTLGATPDALACVRFGLITEETDLEELIALVYTTGKDVEESSKFLEKMSAVVRDGIEKANQDLQRENQVKLAQEGVLRQVPIVSSFVNWFSPISDRIGVKGRAFNLAQGEIESTEQTYKYHMQVQQMSPSDTSTQRQGPLKASLKPSKRRSTSGDVPNSNVSRSESTTSEVNTSHQNEAQGQESNMKTDDRTVDAAADSVPDPSSPVNKDTNLS